MPTNTLPNSEVSNDDSNRVVVEAVGDVAIKSNVIVSEVNPNDDVDRKLLQASGLQQGIPPQIEVLVPSNPYVFEANVVVVNGVDEVNLGKVKTVMAHAHDQDGIWKFTDGRAVAEVINGYNASVRAKGLAPIQFLAICRNNPTERPPEHNISDLDPSVVSLQNSDLVLTVHNDESSGAVDIIAAPTNPQGVFVVNGSPIDK